MKKGGTLVIVALGIALRAGAVPPTPPTPTPQAAPQNTPSVSASAAVSKKGFRWFAPSPVENRYKIERYGNMSSQPWTAIVGWHPGMSQFPTGETAAPALTLVTVKF